jgi:phosphonate transport system substrate-binding protein
MEGFVADVGHEDAPIRFAYASVLSPERSLLTYSHLGIYLSEQLGQPVEIVRRRTYFELNELLRTGGAVAGLVCTGAFAAGEDRFGLEAVAIPVIRGATTYRSYVIVRRDSGIRSFDETQGRAFAFTDPLSNTGYRYVADKLRTRGVAPDAFFGRFLFTYSHDSAIEAVRDGVADAGSIDSLVWDELLLRDPTLADDLVVIERSPKFPINPVAVAPWVSEQLRSDITAVFLSMHLDPSGREVLAELGTDAFVVPPPDALDGYRLIAESWRALEVSATPLAPGVR